MGRGVVNIEVVLFHVLAVVALAVGKSKEPLFEYRVIAIPQGKAKAEGLLIVANAGQPVLPPVIGSGPRLVVSEIVPSIPILTVIFTYCSPLSLTQIRAPFSPRDLGCARFLKSDVFWIIHKVFNYPSHLWPAGLW